MRNTNPIAMGDRVRVNLDPAVWRADGWLDGTIVRIDPYSAHRSFYWVELDAFVELTRGGRTNLVAVLNPKHMVRI